MINVIKYDIFELITFKNIIELDYFGRKSDKYFKTINRDDFISSISLDYFIKQPCNIPIRRIDYLKYWNYEEHRNKKVLDTYDAVMEIQCKLEVEATRIFNELGHDCFIIPMNGSEINYLRQSDLYIESTKFLNTINSEIEEQCKVIDNKITLKLDNLCNRTEIAFNRIGEYSRQKNNNPNLRIQNKTGYLLSEIT